MIELHGRIDPVKHLQGTMKAVVGDVYNPPPVYIEPKLQAKTATPTGENQKIVPDDGYDGLSSVAINAVLLQAKTVKPEQEDVYVQPDNGYTGLSIVCVKALSETESVDFSNYHNGSFTETLLDGTKVVHTIEFDSSGVPVSVDGILLKNIQTDVEITGVE